jgi:hypothetical protein
VPDNERNRAIASAVALFASLGSDHETNDEETSDSSGR